MLCNLVPMRQNTPPRPGRGVCYVLILVLLLLQSGGPRTRGFAQALSPNPGKAVAGQAPPSGDQRRPGSKESAGAPKVSRTDGGLLSAQRNDQAPAGKQRKEGKNAAAAESFLNVVLRIKPDAPAEVLKATEVSGKLISRGEAVSDFIYEITRDNRTLMVGFLPEDPFLVRGFEDPAHKRGENLGQGKSATIVFNVPETDMASATQGRIGFRYYKVQSGTEVDAISPTVLNELKERHRLTTEFDLSPHQLALAIMEKTNKLPR